jgi:hypothetical protein
MSFVTLSLFNQLNTLRRLDSGYQAMQSNQSQMNLLQNGMDSSSSALLAQEKQIAFTGLNARIQQRISEVRENSLEKQLHKDIQDSFSTFA